MASTDAAATKVVPVAKAKPEGGSWRTKKQPLRNIVRVGIDKAVEKESRDTLAELGAGSSDLKWNRKGKATKRASRYDSTASFATYEERMLEHSVQSVRDLGLVEGSAVGKSGDTDSGGEDTGSCSFVTGRA